MRQRGYGTRYESRYANPHVILEDLSSLVHGEERTRVYLRQLSETQKIQTKNV